MAGRWESALARFARGILGFALETAWGLAYRAQSDSGLRRTDVGSEQSDITCGRNDARTSGSDARAGALDVRASRGGVVPEETDVARMGPGVGLERSDVDPGRPAAG